MLKLRCAFSENPRVAPLADGTVQPRDCELTFEQDHPGAWFERHLREGGLDVFEFSIAHYLITKDRPRPEWDWIALPLYLSKGLFSLQARVRRDAAITQPTDLRGKRFGIPDFTMTAGLWFRAMMRELYGLQPNEVRWFVGRSRAQSQGVRLGLDERPLPSGISLTWLYEAGSLDRLLRAGELDAAFASTEDPIREGDEQLQPLFPDAGRQVVQRFFERRGFVPPNHTVLMQRRLAEEHPWLPAALYEAFEQSKQEAYRRDPRARSIFPDDPPGRFGDDPYPSGLAANRATLQMAAEQEVLEGTIGKPPDVDSLIQESLRGT